MKFVDLILHARWVVPIIPRRTLLTEHSVIIDQGNIIDILPAPSANQHYQAKETRDLPNHVVMPGMINMHTHTPMSLFRGLADDLPLMDWLQNHIWPAEMQCINEESVAVGSQLAIAEMLRGGTTCFNDHYMFHHTTAEVAKQAGIRACLGLQMMDVETQWAKNGAEALQKGLKIQRETPSHPLITWALAPHAPYTITDDTFRAIRKVSLEQGLQVHLHLHETASEITRSIEEFGKSPIARLRELDLYNEQLIAVHMVHVSDDEIRLTQESGVHVVHCPESNLKLASGFAPIHNFLAAGVNVSIGTDGAASNNDLDLFGELQTAALLAKAVSQNPSTLSALEALEMVTINAARALGLEHKIGSLEKGKAADIIAVDLSDLITQPIYDPRSHLVYAMNRLQVSDVWVNGNILLKNHKLTMINTETLLKKVDELATRISATY